MSTKTKLEIRRLAACNEAHKLALRDARNEVSVRRAMYTTHVITAEEHAKWLDRVQSDARVRVFAVLLSGRVVGSASVSRIDLVNGTADWAFYLSETARGGIGRIIEFHMLEFVFGELGLDKLNCEVLAFNEGVIALHKQFGFAHEGTRRQEKRRGDDRLDVVLMGMIRAEWLANRARIAEDHAALFDRFDVTWEG